MRRDPLTTYAMGHFAGAHTGVAMFRAAAKRHEGSPWGRDISGLASDIEADRERLERILRALGRRPSSLPQRATRYTLEGIGRASSVLHGWAGLSSVTELEKLRNAVAAKGAGWEVLIAAAAHDSRLARGELEKLLERAHAQSEQLRTIHLQMAQQVFQKR